MPMGGMTFVMDSGLPYNRGNRTGGFMREFIRNHTLPCLLVPGGLMAIAFQGSRGLLEPDEGRYSNVALQILQHNDCISL